MATPLGSIGIIFGADVSQFTKNLTKAEGRLNKTKTKFKDVTKNGIKPFQNALAGFALAAFTKDTLALGLAAEETGSKFATTFGESTDSVDEFLDSFANMAGLTKAEGQEIAATAGAIAQGLGISSEASAEFSKDIVSLAGDLNSFHNLQGGTEEASRAITSALTGETEQLKKMGIVIRQADVQTRALNDTGKTNAKTLTDQEKAAATFALIMERAGPAVGDLARTQDSATNASRNLVAQLRDVQTVIGQALVPVFAKAVEWMNALLKGIQILAVDSAVWFAKMKMNFARMFLDQEAFEQARQNWQNMTAAAREMRDEIVGVTAPAHELGAGLAVVNAEAQGFGDILADLTGPALKDFASTTVITVPIIQGLVSVIDEEKRAALEAAAATDKLNNTLGKFSKFSGLIGQLGGLFGLAIPFVGQIGGGIGILKGFAGLFAGGGMIGPGEWGIAGEAGPEIVQGGSSGATVTPSGAGGVTVVLQTETGRKLVDAIATKSGRDSDLRRVFRVPVAAIATG